MTDQCIITLHNHKEIIPEAFIICQTSDLTKRQMHKLSDAVPFTE